MFENINTAELWQNFLTWGSEHFWTINTLYEGLIITGSVIIAGVIYSFIRGKILQKINDMAAPATAKRVARNFVRLLLPFMILALIFIGAQIAKLDPINLDTALTEGLAKVLGAWIIIRIMVQLIENSAARNLVAIVIWSIVALSILGILPQTMAALDAISFTVGNFRLSALLVIKSILLLCALLYIALFASSYAERRILKSKSLTRSSQVLIAKITRVTLIVTALLIGVTSAGIDLSLFAVFGGAIGLGIGFGLQKGISNLFSGMLLLMYRSIKPGDVIEIPELGTFGWVNEMAARYTEIVTRDNKSFLIPNEEFITQRVVNWSHGNSLIRIQVTFGVHYNSDMERVVEIAKEAATKPARVVETPEPVCWITEFGDSSVNFVLRFWIKDAEAGVTNVKGEVMMALWKAFKEHNVQIPFPHREVFIHEGKD